MVVCAVLLARVRSVVLHPLPWTVLVFLAGVAIRVHYTLVAHNPARFVYSDMNLYMSLAKRFAQGTPELARWDVTHPLGYSWFLGMLLRWDPTLERATQVHLAVGILVPLAVGLLGYATFGRRTAYAATVFASLYYPFIEFGGVFLSEIHFIFWLTLTFVALFAASRSRTVIRLVLLSFVAGLALSLAAALKSVALPAVASFFAVQVVAFAFSRGSFAARLRWLRDFLMRSITVGLGAAPLLTFLARVCTAANQDKFCVTGNKMGADFLLGHYGRVAAIKWGVDEGRTYQFGSPGAALRHYTEVVSVPFPITDSAANAAAAWSWVRDHPVAAIVLSLDHVYDAFFGSGMWPTYETPFWCYADLSQHAFVLLLFLPTVLALNTLVRKGVRTFMTNQILLVLAPVAALAVVVALATGEVRYRIPFDVFFIVVTCAYVFAEVRYAEVALLLTPLPAVLTRPARVAEPEPVLAQRSVSPSDTSAADYVQLSDPDIVESVQLPAKTRSSRPPPIPSAPPAPSEPLAPRSSTPPAMRPVREPLFTMEEPETKPDESGAGSASLDDDETVDSDKGIS